MGSPDFTSACRPPALITFGSVHPGNGRNRSLAPVASTSFVKPNSYVASVPSAHTKFFATSNTRVPQSISISSADRRSTQAAASDVQSSTSPRQIWPPTVRLSSTIPTRKPHSAALTLAARPAGPPPIVSTSKCFRISLRISAHFHFRLAKNLAAAAVAVLTNGHATLKANTHAAQRSSALAVDRFPARTFGHHHGDSYSRSKRYNYAIAVHLYGDWLTHVRAPQQYATANKARLEFPVCGLSDDQSTAEPFPATL